MLAIWFLCFLKNLKNDLGDYFKKALISLSITTQKKIPLVPILHSCEYRGEHQKEATLI